MDEYKYTQELDDDHNERVPEVKQNQVSEKKVIGISIAIAVWIFVFMLLRAAGIISALIMRVCIYPVVIGIVVMYFIVKFHRHV